MTNYLTEQDIIRINEYSIKRYSPKEPTGVAQQTALEMIIALPKQGAFGRDFYPTVLDKAVIVYQKLVKKHVFYNGNKRTAYHSLTYFLYINGYAINMPTSNIVELAVKVATTDMTDSEIILEIQDYISEL